MIAEANSENIIIKHQEKVTGKSHLDYASPVWDRGPKKKDTDNIEMVQRRVSGYLTNPIATITPLALNTFSVPCIADCMKDMRLTILVKIHQCKVAINSTPGPNLKTNKAQIISCFRP